MQSGDNVLIGGIIVGDGGNKRVLIRGVGPSLSTKGISNPLANPVLQIFQGGTKIAENDDWKSTQQADIQATGLAPTDDKEAAILIDLAPGSYTMIVRSKDTTTGIGLVEAYEAN